MSAHYYDAGSGPHDSAAAREDGTRNCGCRHDGLRWLEMCQAARNDWQRRHDAAVLEHAKAVQP